MSTPRDDLTFRLDWGVHGLLRLLSSCKFQSVLDIGSGMGEHKRFLELFGKNVYSVDLVKNADYVGDFMEVNFDRKFDVIWCSHVLEHQRNVGVFLDKIFDLLDDNGIFAVVVPLHPRERLISGHLTSWSIPLLCYNLIMAGFDCKEASIMLTFDLNLLVRKKQAQHKELRAQSAHGADAGVEFSGIEQFFPFPAGQGVEIQTNQLIEHNWVSSVEYLLPMPVESGAEKLIQIESKHFHSEQDRPRLLFR